MTDRIVLDASPLSHLCHPNEERGYVREIRAWLDARLRAGVRVFIPEIADYEVRREFLRLGKTRNIQRLDALQALLSYLPLDTPTMRRAAELWAQLRNAGQPTADPKEIDADVILAAQAERVGAVVATENVGHLARHWREIE